MALDSDEVPRERQRRRRYDAAFKRALVEQTLVPGASVARIARAHDINANQLFKWRRELLQSIRAGQDTDNVAASLVPVTVVEEEPLAKGASVVTAPQGQITIAVPGAEVRIRGTVDEAMLRLVLSSLQR